MRPERTMYLREQLTRASLKTNPRIPATISRMTITTMHTMYCVCFGGEIYWQFISHIILPQQIMDKLQLCGYCSPVLRPLRCCQKFEN